jgi:aminobenzoyl-glutamate utilization protein B
MMVAAQTLALTAIDLFSNPALMKKAQEEFQQKLGDYKYEPLLGNRKPALNYRD